MTLREGYCGYCGEARMVEVEEIASQEMINEEVTYNCRCFSATQVREKKEQKENCISNIEEMLNENYPEIAKLFKESIDAIQDNKIKKISVNTHRNQTARISKTKDGIKVELEKKQKAETLA